MPTVFDAANLEAPHSQREMGAEPSAPQDPPQLPYKLSRAEQDVLDERRGQRTREGFIDAHDDEHDSGELARAGACYALFSQTPTSQAPLLWPLEARWWKPSNVRRMLVKAAALIIAEIERIDRKTANHEGSHE